MIDVKTGNLNLDDRQTSVRRDLTRSEFLRSDLSSDVVVKQEGEFSNYYLGPVSIDGVEFVLTLIFKGDGTLSMINLAQTEGKGVPEWGDWSEEKERQRKILHDRWLSKTLGKPPYQYPWGTATSAYDPRSGSSLITIEYSPPTE